MTSSSFNKSFAKGLFIFGSLGVFCYAIFVKGEVDFDLEMLNQRSYSPLVHAVMVHSDMNCNFIRDNNESEILFQYFKGDLPNTDFQNQLVEIRAEDCKYGLYFNGKVVRKDIPKSELESFLEKGLD
jgi:hypothetical protein